MRWLALVHVALALAWGIAALRLPTEMARALAQAPASTEGRARVRRLFIGIATPAALFTVVSGTALRAGHGLDTPWPLLHLAVASFLVWTHGATAVLVIKLERDQPRGLLTASRVLCACTLTLLLAFSTLALLAPGPA